MLPSFYGVIEVKHYHQGRLRIQTDVLKENQELEATFIENLKQIEGIISIRVNPILGTALVVFDENKLQGSFLYLVILRMLGIEEEAFRSKIGKFRSFAKSVGEAIDFSIYNKTKGLLDSKTVFASVLVFYGLRKISTMPQLPTGATLLWWAFNLMSKGGE